MSQYPLLLIDGTGLLVRSSRAGRRHSLQADGVSTTTLTLFARSACKLLRDQRPGHVLVAFDGRGSRDWRRSRYAGYKAGRREPPEQETAEHRLVHEFCRAAGLMMFSYESFEADDVIAWAQRMARAEDPAQPVVIASDDADLHQLLGEHTVQVGLTGMTTVTTAEQIRTRWGCEPLMLPRVRVLAGDRSDGIPGVRNIGPKRAVRMLEARQWSLPEVAGALPAEDPYLLAAFDEILDLALPIRAIDYQPGMEHAPILAMARWDPSDTDSLRMFFKRFHMETMLASLEGGRLW